MSSQQIRVVIADPWSVVNESISALLTTDPGFGRPGMASTPGDTLDLVDRLRPDLILLDPEIGGGPEWDLIAQIRQISPESVILIHTGSVSMEALFRAIELGGHDLLSKGLPPRQLLHRLKMACHRHFFLNPAIARRLLSLIDEQDNRLPTSDPLDTLELAVLQALASYTTVKDIAYQLQLTTEQVFGEIDLVIGKLQHAFQTGTRLVYYPQLPPTGTATHL